MLECGLAEASKIGMLTKCYIPLRRAFTTVWMAWLKCKFAFSNRCVGQGHREGLKSSLPLLTIPSPELLSPPSPSWQLGFWLGCRSSSVLTPRLWSSPANFLCLTPCHRGPVCLGCLTRKLSFSIQLLLQTKSTSSILQASLKAQTFLLQISTDSSVVSLFLGGHRATILSYGYLKQRAVVKPVSVSLSSAYSLIPQQSLD